MTADHRRSIEWIEATSGTAPTEHRPELVAAAENRRQIAQQIREAVEPIEDSARGRALRDRALLIELEESPTGAAGLLAECEALGLEVVE
jgi:hypothetical protein